MRRNVWASLKTKMGIPWAKTSVTGRVKRLRKTLKYEEDESEAVRCFNF